MTHGSDISSEVLLFKRESINKWLCDAPLGSSCALTWNTCVASSSLSSFLRVESRPVIGLMPMGQSLSKMEYLNKESRERSSLTMNAVWKHAGKNQLYWFRFLPGRKCPAFSVWLIKYNLFFSGKTFIYLLKIGRGVDRADWLKSTSLTSARLTTVVYPSLSNTSAWA